MENSFATGLWAALWRKRHGALAERCKEAWSAHPQAVTMDDLVLNSGAPRRGSKPQ